MYEAFGVRVIRHRRVPIHPCHSCGKPVSRLFSDIAYHRHRRKRRLCGSCGVAKSVVQRRAIALVAASVRDGLLKPAKDCVCVDCGAPARDYDHRDYSKPLDVEPVCRGCNNRRGPAISVVVEREAA